MSWASRLRLTESTAYGLLLDWLDAENVNDARPCIEVSPHSDPLPRVCADRFFVVDQERRAVYGSQKQLRAARQNRSA